MAEPQKPTKILDATNMDDQMKGNLDSLCEMVAYAFDANEVLILVNGEQVKAAIGNMPYLMAQGLLDSGMAHENKVNDNMN